MRILKVVQSYYPFQEKGGTAVKVHALARGLASRGHKVTVLTADLGLSAHEGNGIHAERCEWGWRAMDDGIEAIYLPVRARYRSLTLNAAVIQFCRSAIQGFDLVHFYGLYDLLGPTVSYFCRRKCVPYVLEPMGMYRPIDRSLLLKTLWHCSLGRSFVRGAARIVATSELEQEDLLLAGIPEAKVVLRYNGVDWMPQTPSFATPGKFRAKWNIPSDEILILFLGRLIPRKGADIAIEAFAEACPASGRLVIAGPEGERGYRAYLEKCARDCGIESRVVFTGPVYDADKDALMFDADLFVLPSRYENFANSAAEAMAHGVPVVVTKSCGIRSVVQGQAGLVIELGKGALTEAIRRLIDDRALYAGMKEGCRRVAERLGWNQLAEQMESHYAEAIAIST